MLCSSEADNPSMYSHHGSWEGKSDCPDCGGETRLIDAGYVVGERYEVHQCVSECEQLFDHNGDVIYEGRDHQDRMTERRQMGLCRF